MPPVCQGPQKKELKGKYEKIDEKLILDRNSFLRKIISMNLHLFARLLLIRREKISGHSRVFYYSKRAIEALFFCQQLRRSE
jgi:hypothetical protein